MRARDDLPISPLLPEIVASLAAHPRLVLEAPPGAGKTTQVPLALLDAPWLAGKIIMLEPRRLAARSAAAFMAKQLGEEVGETVGYRIRFDTRVSARTRIEVVTEAILTRMLQDDPTLEGVGVLLFDEFHERHLHSDLGLALALEVQHEVRADLRIMAMSATLEGERLAHYLDAPRLTSAGRSFPVDIAYLATRGQEDEHVLLRRAVEQALTDTDGDVLVFLPGKAEIDRAQRMFEPLLASRDVRVLILHGELGIEAQSAVLAAPKAGERRVVLATNVAESSVTLPAVRAVVDSGMAREPRFDAQSGLSRLETVRIAQASATQRAGRAGRLAPGCCYRLWPESMRLDAAIRPEIAHVELSALALELASWGKQELRWLDAPPPGPLAEARERLQLIGALDHQGRITRHGRALLALPTHPRLAHAMLDAPRAWQGLACDLAALIEARDPLRGEARRSDDLRERVLALQHFRRERKAPADADRHALAAIEQTAANLRKRVQAERDDGAPHEHALGEVLALAFPERIARASATDGRRYQLANARGARLFDDSRLRGAAWLAVSDLRFDEKDSVILRAAPVDEDYLRERFADSFARATSVRFNPETRAVEALDESRFAGIVLERRSVGAPRDARSAAMLCTGIAQLGVACLPWTEPLRQWQARALCLRAWCEDLQLPDVSDAALSAAIEDWLAPFLEGKARVAEIDAALLGEALHALLDYSQRKALDEHAPVALTVPSGNSKRLEYEPGKPPVLAVKLQELFGLTDTPRVAKGRVPVTLHLLSPAQRPIQVTQDLKGFWERTYPEVKKELKGRYPKHPWPDDPWSAKPTARAKPRGT
jgi:ATP-dependent helicase HrpB